MPGLRSREGIERRHIHEARGRWWQQAPVGLIGLGILLSASFFGWLGTEAERSDSREAVTLTVDAPVRIRNGEFYEMTFRVEAHRAVGELVLLVDVDVWRDVTVNTFVPAPTEEGMRGEAFEFRFGPLEAGSELLVKVDAQVNPDHAPNANRGAIAIADGDGSPLASVDYSLEVLP
jgi:hypothetical protein